MTPPEPRRTCLEGGSDISAPLFDFSESQFLPAFDAHTRPDSDGALLALTGPSVTAEAGHLPVRGDLAHIKLAGRYFVPHYAVPMPHRLVAASGLRRSAKPESDTLEILPEGATFDVLDMAGGWAWGQYGEDGPVGYVPLVDLEAAR